MVGKMAHMMACEWACKMACQWACKRALQWACKKAFQWACKKAYKWACKRAFQWARKMAYKWACKRAFQWACRMVWVGHKMVWVACILKNNPVLAHMMLDNMLGLVVADILHSGNPVVDRMVDSIQGAAAGSYIAGVGNTQGAAADSYIPGVDKDNTQAGNLIKQHMGSSFAEQRLEQHTNLKIHTAES